MWKLLFFETMKLASLHCLCRDCAASGTRCNAMLKSIWLQWRIDHNHFSQLLSLSPYKSVKFNSNLSVFPNRTANIYHTVQGNAVTVYQNIAPLSSITYRNHWILLYIVIQNYSFCDVSICIYKERNPSNRKNKTIIIG